MSSVAFYRHGVPVKTVRRTEKSVKKGQWSTIYVHTVKNYCLHANISIVNFRQLYGACSCFILLLSVTEKYQEP